MKGRKSKVEMAAEETQRTKVRLFEDLRVFQEARELVKEVYALTRSGPMARDLGLVSQMRRAAVSVLSNIAEGFERETDAEFIRALYISKGSCGELRAQSLVALDARYWTQEQQERVASRCRGISGRLSKLIEYLKKSPRPRRSLK